jgi:hypothetical protein
MDRRDSLKWMLAASATSLLQRPVLGAAPAIGSGAVAARPAATVPVGGGYGSDPDLLKSYKAGDVWPLVLTSAQRRTATALCDVIIPADDHSPSASAVGVVDFLDEWASAPYPRHQDDRSLIEEGFAWLDTEAKRRFGSEFASANLNSQAALCDDICDESSAKEGLARAAMFFARFRDLTAGGFYSTPVGFRDVGYIGNVPLTKFEGPPQDLLRKLGLSA